MVLKRKWSEMLPLKEAQAKRYLDPAGKLQSCLGYIGNKYLNLFHFLH
jgi:hypothetical protein